MRHVHQGFVDYNSACILQPSDGTRLFDHCPLTFIFYYKDWHFDPSQLYFPHCNWSAAELDAFACDKRIQQQLAKRVDTLADETVAKFENWVDLGLVDDCWGLLNQILRTAAQV